MTKSSFRKVIEDAERYPLPMRIAANYINSGGDIYTWICFCRDNKDIPDTIMNAIFNYIRDCSRMNDDEFNKIPAI